MNNLLKRTLFGILYVVVMVAGITLGLHTFALLFTIVTALLLMEFYGLLNAGCNLSVNTTISTLAGVLLFLGVCLSSARSGQEVPFLMPYILTLIYLLASELYRTEGRSFLNWLAAMGGHIYIALPFALLSIINYRLSYGSEAVPKSLALAVFIFLWVNDTGAYCVGSLLSRRIPYRLFPSISPKKSWIGSVGGAIVTLIAATIFHHLSGGFSLLVWSGLALVCIVFGTLGDLVESQIKREIGVKDSGRLLPGHGGMLDRFDSALLAIPAALVYLSLIL